MKLMRVFVVALATMLSFAAVYGRDLKHSIYAVEREWVKAKDVPLEELRDFDFIYLMAAPNWQPDDFDFDYDEIHAKYVGNHQYQNQEGILAMIDGVHNAGGKILCSFPGTAFSKITPDSLRSAKFAQMMADFVKKYNYDGIELDWEHTVTEESHLGFMKHIRRALDGLGDNRKHWLTTALHDFRKYTPEQAAELSSYVDWINIMFYDMGGGNWGKIAATHNSPLDVMERTLNTNWAAFDPQKLHIGFPNYGFYYKGIKPGEKVPEGKTLRDYGRYCNATELPALLEKGWTEQWDDVAQCPYYISPDGNEFMTLESTRSLDAKFDWVKRHNLGGIFWWEYSCDWLKPTAPSTRGKHLLTDHIIQKLK